MSPLPSPSPLRRRVLQVVFSPAGLLCGFVALLIYTCPGARGDGSLGLATASDPLPVVGESPTLNLPMTAAPADRVVPPRSAARSLTPAERTGRPVGGATTFPRPARPSLPLIDPLTPATAAAPARTIVPMSGPPVGIRPRLTSPVR